jgi:hypothetical protein
MPEDSLRGSTAPFLGGSLVGRRYSPVNSSGCLALPRMSRRRMVHKKASSEDVALALRIYLTAEGSNHAD